MQLRARRTKETKIMEYKRKLQARAMARRCAAAARPRRGRLPSRPDRQQQAAPRTALVASH